MIYPSGALIQTYNVSAGRIIQLPCFYDQDEPPEGFRAVIFSGAGIIAGSSVPNQTGPTFVAGTAAAIDFDLSQLLQGGALSRLRSIYVESSYSVAPASPVPLVVRLASGFAIPLDVTPPSGTPGSLTASDFVSAEPAFSVQASGSATTAANYQFVIALTNFRLSINGHFGTCADPLFAS